MNDKPENPSAFPGNKWTPDNQDVSEGMTLRDYFAAAAIQGLLSNPNAELTAAVPCANFAFCVADAMLKARNS